MMADLYTSGMAYALAAMVCFGLSDLVYKRAAGAGVQAHQLLFVQSWQYGPMVLLYGWFTHTLTFNLSSLWGVVAGVFAFVAFYSFAKSLSGGSVSVNAPIFRLSFTLTAALAVLLLGEPLGPYKLAGLACALLAVWLLLGGKAPASKVATVSHAGMRASLTRVGIATVTLGIANLIYKIGLMSGATPAALLVAQAGVVMSLSAFNAWRIDGHLRASRIAWGHATVTATLLTAAFVFLFQGLARGEASRLVPVAQMGFVVTAAVGFFFLREPFSARKGAGLMFALTALACLAKS
ncbi:MAG TPA: EamA family transporter [Burkholderiales bacterium]|jgi:drug/metabolite transporter (DMT)-like permease|nr:EamA family transporter [Burkholderiales bacterium]